MPCVMRFFWKNIWKQEKWPDEEIAALIGTAEGFSLLFWLCPENGRSRESDPRDWKGTPGVPVYPEAFGAKVYKIARDDQGNRLTYMKITGGTLKVKETSDYQQGKCGSRRGSVGGKGRPDPDLFRRQI